jgi:hypothetical protein
VVSSQKKFAGLGGAEARACVCVRVFVNKVDIHFPRRVSESTAGKKLKINIRIEIVIKEIKHIRIMN